MPTPTPWARPAAGVALVLALAGCKVELYSGLSETEANEVVAALADGRIAARKEHMEGADWQVQVDEDRVGAALELLRAQGLSPELQLLEDESDLMPELWQRFHAAVLADETLLATYRELSLAHGRNKLVNWLIAAFE